MSIAIVIKLKKGHPPNPGHIAIPILSIMITRGRLTIFAILVITITCLLFTSRLVQGEKAKVGVSNTIRSAVDSTPVVVFSKSYCPYCKAAKDLLKKLNIGYKAFEMDEIDRMEDQSKMFQLGKYKRG